jgi:hypothetical protein
MNYKIDATVEKDYLMLIVAGEQSLDANKALVIMIIESCVEHQLNKVVVDIRGFEGQPGVISDYELANFSVEKGLSVLKKAALVYRKENHEFTSFFETVAINRGLNVKIFLEPDEAVGWITKD